MIGLRLGGSASAICDRYKYTFDPLRSSAASAER
jgi:hypothetical protein